MCFSRNLIVASALVSAALLAGCQRTQPYTLAQMNPTPILPDEAMAYRNFDHSRMLYSNGSSVASPTLFPIEMKQDLSYAEQIVAAPSIYYSNLVILPISAIVTPPWTDIVYAGVRTPPTYTAVPATPDDARWFR